MRLIGTETGRVAQLFPVEELRPLNGVVLRDAVELITEQFGFIVSPNLSQPRDSSQDIVFKFESGSYFDDSDNMNIGQFQIYTDGLVASANTTDIAEKFIEHFIEWGKSVIGLRDLQRPPKIVYTSAVIVEFDADANEFVSKFELVQNALTQRIRGLYGIKEGVKLKRISWACDPTIVPQSDQYSEFVLERRLSSPYNHQRFHSVAPFPTNDNIAELRNIEHILLGRN